MPDRDTLLLDAYRLSDHPSINKAAEYLLSEYGEVKRNPSKFRHTFKIILLNIKLADQEDKGLSIPLAPRFYSGGRLHKCYFGFSHVKNIVKFLECNEYITVTKGVPGRLSIIDMNESLRQLLLNDCIDIGYDMALAPFVRLNKKVKGDSIQMSTPRTQKRYTIERHVRAINECINDSDITLPYIHSNVAVHTLWEKLAKMVSHNSMTGRSLEDNLIKIKMVLHRVFGRGDKKLLKGGRFYSSSMFGGIHPQGLSGQARSAIMINGESTVELDYSGLHTRMLYAEKGIQKDGDIYECPWPRPLVKQILNTAINGNGKTKDIAAVRYEISYKWRNTDDDYKRSVRQLYYRYKDYMSQIYDTTLALHPLIADQISNDRGIDLQYKDSCIMNDILMHFTAQGICAIPIHDSVIVQERYRDELHRVMDETYRKHMGGFSCPIK